METRTPHRARSRRGFTMIELLVVIAIIAILAAILFPIFGTVREQARQSSTMSNMQAIYVGARLFYEDEGRFPQTLFGYAEVRDSSLGSPQTRPMKVGETPVPMKEATGAFRTQSGSILRGYLYREQVKDHATFLGAVDPVNNLTEVTPVYWPLNSPMANGQMVRVNWMETVDGANGCKIYGDSDLPNSSYVGEPKLFYKRDNMTIGPMLDAEGRPMRESDGQLMYELHYTPDWTHQLGSNCDFNPNLPTRPAYITQLKYRNPPLERTVLTYNTHHVASSGSPYVLMLLANGTAKKITAKEAVKQLPLLYGQP